MREYTLKIDKALLQGLRPEERMIMKSSFLYQAQNAIPRAEGMSLYETITDPFSSSPTVAYPFPQLFRGKEVTLLCFENTIYTVTETAGAWTTSLITTYDYASTGSTKAIATGGGIWQFIDYGADAWFLFNGNEVVFKSRHLEFSGGTAKVFVQDDIDINTGCYHMGRHLTGGFNESNFWNSDWQTFFTIWTDKITAVNADIPIDATHGLGQNYVMGSAIGGGDVLGHFYPDISIKGITEEQTSAKPLFLDMLERNDAFFMPMPTPGKVMCVKPLGKNVIVYSEDGITALQFSLSPTPTYGVKQLKSFGIYERGAVGGDDFMHTFVNTSGDVFTITPDLDVKRLGYKEFIGGMVGNSMLVSQDPLLKDIYISSASDCYLLTSEGLGQTSEIVTSVAMAEGGLVGVSKAISGQTDFLICSDKVDMGYKGIKMIQSIEVAIDTEDPVYVAVDYRNNKNAAYTRTAFIYTSPEGQAVIPIAGIDFRIVVKVPYVDSTNWYVEPDYVLVHWKSIDKRFRRGLANVSETT